MELWNAYLRDGTMTDGILVRDEPIPDGLYHLVTEVLVRHVDGSYLAMRRTADKKVFPGWLETTAGGSALLGEDPLACVRRELAEETGILCDDFVEVARHINDRNHSLFYCFVCTVDVDKDAIILQEGETDGFVWMDEAEFIDFVNSDRMIPSQKQRMWDYFVKIGYAR